MGVASTHETALAGTNNDLVFTALLDGVKGDDITVAYVDTGSLSVSMSGFDITINIDAGVTLASEVLAAVEASSPASGFVSVANAGGNDGTGTVSAFGSTSLSGGGVGSEPAVYFNIASNVANLTRFKAKYSTILHGGLSTAAIQGAVSNARISAYNCASTHGFTSHGNVTADVNSQNAVDTQIVY